jgi:hypothetical protein
MHGAAVFFPYRNGSLQICFKADLMPDYLSKSSRRLLTLSLVTPRPCHCGGCICLTPPERRAMRRVARIVRLWKRQTRRQEQARGR